MFGDLRTVIFTALCKRKGESLATEIRGRSGWDCRAIECQRLYANTALDFNRYSAIRNPNSEFRIYGPALFSSTIY